VTLQILDAPHLLNALNLSPPVGLTLIAILHLVVDSDDPYGMVTATGRGVAVRQLPEEIVEGFG
jgi:hypothetical protein